jgi:hypothetical protein
MTHDQKNSKQCPVGDEETPRNMNKSEKKRARAKNKLSQIRERAEPVSPEESRTTEGSAQGSIAEVDYDEQGILTGHV